MQNVWLWLQSPQGLVLIGFHVFLAFVLALDLGVFRRQSHVVQMREAGLWSVAWVCLAGLFAACIWRFWDAWFPERGGQGTEKAMEFVAGYLVELSLSVDNLFVFLVIFRHFGVPEQYRHRVLVWGILGAVGMRAVFILAGAAILHYFEWMIYLFAVFLVYTAFKLARSPEAEIDPSRNWLLRLARRFLPVIDSYESPHFWVRHNGRWHATPLPLVLLVVDSADMLFAFDSIPAIFGITHDPFIVYTSNIFAIIGLRSLFFLLAGFLGKFRYLNVGLSAVLMFVGIKMAIEEYCQQFLEAHGFGRTTMILLSLGVIGFILAVTALASVLVGEEKTEPPSEITAGAEVNQENH